MITIHKITPQTVDVFYQDQYFGEVNEYELLLLQVQIKAHKAIGYSILFEDKKISIDSKGKLEYYPDQLFFQYLKNKLQILSI